MKIAICGTHSVGKSTLATILSEKTGLPLITEVVRGIAATHGFKNTDQVVTAAKDQQIKFQQDLLEAQLMQENAHPQGFISDRSMIDFLAYNFLYELPSITIAPMYTKALLLANNYDLLIRCPIPIDTVPTPDGFRLTDIKSQQIVDDAILALLPEVPCKVLHLSSYREDWVDACLKAIGGLSHD